MNDYFLNMSFPQHIPIYELVLPSSLLYSPKKVIILLSNETFFLPLGNRVLEKIGQQGKAYL